MHGFHRALLHITSFQKFARFKSYVDSLCCLIFSEKTEFEQRKDAFICAGALHILISLHSELTRDEDNSEVASYHYLDQAISALNHE